MGEVGEIVDAILYLERAKSLARRSPAMVASTPAGGKSHLSPQRYTARYVARRCLRKTKPASFKNKQNTLIKTNMKNILLIQSRGSESYREKLPIRSLTIFKRVIPGKKWLSAMWRKIRRRSAGRVVLRQSSH